MTVILCLLAVAVTMAAISYLAVTDPKRRRTFGMPEPERPRRPWVGISAVFAPGLVLLLLGNGAAFVVWLGALSVAGWGVAALRPEQASAIAATVRAAPGQTDTLLAAAWCVAGRRIEAAFHLYRLLRTAPSRIAELEHRVAELEAMLEAAPAEPPRAPPLLRALAFRVIGNGGAGRREAEQAPRTLEISGPGGER